MKIQDFDRVSQLREELAGVFKSKALIIGERGFRISRLQSTAHAYTVIDGWRDGENADLYVAIKGLLDRYYDDWEKRILDELHSLGVTTE